MLDILVAWVTYLVGCRLTVVARGCHDGGAGVDFRLDQVGLSVSKIDEDLKRCFEIISLVMRCY